MTFTKRPDGATSCDSCHTPVTARTWRELDAHRCPRTNPVAPRPRCESVSCNKPLIRREGEGLNDYRRRRFCGRSCATTHSNKERAL